MVNSIFYAVFVGLVFVVIAAFLVAANGGIYIAD
jgi:hypothetical protein